MLQLPGGAKPLVTNAVQPNGPKDMPVHQRHYLESLQQRIIEVENLISDESPLALHFSHAVDSSSVSTLGSSFSPAQQHNILLEQQLQQIAAQNPTHASQLLGRWKKATERNTDKQAGIIVPVKGLKGLNERITLSQERVKAMVQSTTEIASDTDDLHHRNQQMKHKLDMLKARHSLISNEFIKTVNLIESIAISSGVYEQNVRCGVANAQLLVQIENEFQCTHWQQRLDTLRAMLNTIQKGNEVAVPENVSSMSSKPNLLNLLKLLTVQSDTVEQLLQSLANSESLIKRLEESIANEKGSK